MSPRRKPVNKQGNRNLACIHYNLCLDHAVKHRWKHWHCNQCAYKSQKKALDAVQTVPDAGLCYEIPSNLSRQFYHR